MCPHDYYLLEVHRKRRSDVPRGKDGAIQGSFNTLKRRYEILTWPETPTSDNGLDSFCG
jgi:hypothetical protein